MNKNKFVISNIPENIVIPEEKPEKPNRRGPIGGFRLGMPGDNSNMSDEEIKRQSEKAMEELSKMFNVPHNELDAILSDINQTVQNLGIEKMLEEGKKITDEDALKITNEFIQKLEKHSNRSSDEDSFTELDTDNDDMDFGGNVEADKEGSSNIGNNYHVVDTPNSFGMVKCESYTNLYDKFKELYGEGDYRLDIFVPKVNGYNLIHGLDKIKTLHYEFHTEKFIVFTGVPVSINDEPIVVSVVYNEDQFEIVVPEYGNTYDFNSGDLFDIALDSHLYTVVNDEAVLKKPIDKDKIKAGLELVTYTEKYPILSVKNFGKVMNLPSVSPERTNMIKIGRIKSNESTVAKLFKRDFDFDPDQTTFDFYIKLKGEYNSRAIEPLTRYLLNIDYNENKRILEEELKAVSGSSGYIYIELDLGIFPDNIAKWSKE